MNQTDNKETKTRKILLVLFVIFLLLTTTFAAFALNETEVLEIREAVGNDTRIIVDNANTSAMERFNSVSAQLVAINAQLSNLNMTEAQLTPTQINAIAVAVSSQVVANIAVNPFNETQLARLREAIANDTRITVEDANHSAMERLSFVSSQLVAVNGQLSSLNITGGQLTQAQVNSIATSLAAQLNATAVNTCNPYFSTNLTLANSLQAALDGSINNAMDRKFIDQRSWIEQTYIKKNDEYIQLRDEKNLCLQEKSILQNTYDTASVAANYSIKECEGRVILADEQAQTWTWISAALAGVLLMVMIGQGFFKTLLKRT